MSMMDAVTRRKPTFTVPPWVSLKVAKTEAEKVLAANEHIIFARNQSGDVRMADAENALVSLSDHINADDFAIVKALCNSAQGNPELSIEAVRKMVEETIKNTNRPTSCGDTFHVIFSRNLARHANGAKNHLKAKGSHGETEVEMEGGVFRKGRYWTYILPIEALGQSSEVTVAFHQVAPPYTLGESEWWVMRDSPDYPVQTCWVDPDKSPYVSPTTALEDTKAVEHPAIALLKEAIERSGFTVDVEEPHPNGEKEFPDCRLVVDGQEWAVEVTRVLGNAVGPRAVILGVEDTEKHIRRAAKAPPRTSREIEEALRKAVQDKASRAPKVAPGTKYCLTLVDTLEALDTTDQAQWTNLDLSAFDTVVVVRIEEHSPKRLETAKGKPRRIHLIAFTIG